MNKAIDWMARNGVAANLLMVLIIVAGVFSVTAIVQEVFPEFSLDAVQVRVEYPGGAPEEIEEAIVQRVEDRIEGIEGIDRITATAAENFGIVTAELQRGADLARVRTDIKQEVDRITAFPEDAEEPVVQELTNRRQALQIALYGNASERTLKEAAKQLKDELTAYPNISYIEIDGVRDYEISVEVTREALRAYDLTLGQVAQRVRQGSLDLPGGEVETAEEQITIRTEGQNYTKDDFERIVLLSQQDGTKVRLGDVATVVDGFEDSELITRFNGQPAALLKVFRTGDEQVLQIVEQVRQHLDNEVRPSLPAGMEVAIWQNDAENLRSRLDLLIDNGLLGLLLVIIALGLFLNPRLAFWTSVGIFLSFIGTFAVMIALGVSVNLISLFGFILSIGIVVDDAIVVGENIFAEREAGKSPLRAAIDGTKRVGVPVIFAVLTTCAAFAPLLFISGTLGNFLGDIPTIVIAVLLLSLVEVLFILPYHLSDAPEPPEAIENPSAWQSFRATVRGTMDRVRGAVARQLRRFIDGPLDRALHVATRSYGLVICGGIAALLVTAGLIGGGYIRFSFLPEVEGELVTAQLEMPVGTSANETARITRYLEDTGRQTARQLQAELSDDHPNILRNTFTSVGPPAAGQPRPRPGRVDAHPGQRGRGFVRAHRPRPARRLGHAVRAGVARALRRAAQRPLALVHLERGPARGAGIRRALGLEHGTARRGRGGAAGFAAPIRWRVRRAERPAAGQARGGAAPQAGRPHAGPHAVRPRHAGAQRLLRRGVVPPAARAGRGARLCSPPGGSARRARRHQRLPHPRALGRAGAARRSCHRHHQQRAVADQPPRRAPRDHHNGRCG